MGDIRKAVEMDLYMKNIFQQAANDLTSNYVVKNGLYFYKKKSCGSTYTTRSVAPGVS